MLKITKSHKTLTRYHISHLDLKILDLSMKDNNMKTTESDKNNFPRNFYIFSNFFFFFFKTKPKSKNLILSLKI